MTDVPFVVSYNRMLSSSLAVTSRSSVRWKSSEFTFPFCSSHISAYKAGAPVSAGPSTRRSHSRNQTVVDA